MRQPIADTHYNVFHPHKLSAGPSPIPRQSTMHSSYFLTQRATPSYPPSLSFLKSLNHSIAALQFREPSHHVSIIPSRSQPCSSIQTPNSLCSFPVLHVLVYGHFSKAPRHVNFPERVGEGVPHNCAFQALPCLHANPWGDSAYPLLCWLCVPFVHTTPGPCRRPKQHSTALSFSCCSPFLT